MRKPRDLDAELEALAQRAKDLKNRRIVQFGELVIAAGADGLEPETLVGALLSATSASHAEKAAWKEKGAAFFRRGTGGAGGRGRRAAQANGESAAPHARGSASA